MVEEQRRRMEGQTTKIVEDIEKTYLRKIQADMHRCAATCCDNELYSMQKVNSCVENCTKPLNKAQSYCREELERAQNRLQRCVMDCNDNIKDSMGPSPSESEVNKYTEVFDQCAKKCVDSYCDQLPGLEKTMKKFLASKKFD